jgi:hypothetical protein
MSNDLTALQSACAAAENYLLHLLRYPEEGEAFERALDKSRDEVVRLNKLLREQVARL